MPIRACLFFLLLCCFACKSNTDSPKDQIAFDKTKWNLKEGSDYTYRDKMLNDLITNDKLKGEKREKVIDLLGIPDRIDSNYLFYLIAQKRMGPFPLSTKTLVIKLAKDSTVEWRKIHG